MVALVSTPAPVITINDAGGYRVGVYQSLESAISALAQSGGEVILGPGTYTLTRVIEINKSRVTIRGSGASTILVCSGTRSLALTSIIGSYAKTFTLRGLYVNANNVTISDLTLQITSPAGAHVMLANVGSFNKFRNIRVELTSVGVSGNPYYGIANLAVQATLNYNNSFLSCDFIGGDDCLGTVGLYSQASIGSKISSCSFGPAGSGQKGILKYCVQEIACAKTVITGCTFLDLVGTAQQADAMIHSDADAEGHHLVINDNYFENTAAPSGIVLLGGRFVTIDGNVFGRFLQPSNGVIRLRAGGGLSGGTAQSAFDVAIVGNQAHNQSQNHFLDIDNAHSVLVGDNSVTICPNSPQIIVGSSAKRIKMSVNQVVYQRGASDTLAIVAATASGSGLLVNVSNPASIASTNQGSSNTGATLEITGGTATPGVYDVSNVTTTVIQVTNSVGASASVVGTLHNRPVWGITAATVAANGVDLSAITTGPTAFNKYPFSSPIFAGDYVRVDVATGDVRPGAYAIAAATSTTLTLATSCGGAGSILKGAVVHRPVFAATHAVENVESDFSGNSACGYADFVNPLLTPTNSSVGPNHASLTYTAQT